MSRHIIHKQKIRLELSGKLDAQSIQQRVSSIWKDDLAEKIEAILDELAPPDRLIRIESLHLNLGTMESGQFEELFKERLISRLKDALLTVPATGSSAETTTDPAYGKSPAYKPGTGKPGNDSSHSGNLIMDSFLFFLRYGRLPWYCETIDIPKWETTISQIPQIARNSFLSWYGRQANWQPSIIQRLIFQFPDSFLFRLLSVSVPQWAPCWVDVYKDLNSILINIYKLKTDTARDVIWKSAFLYILDASHETQTITAQIRAILEKIIESLHPDGSISSAGGSMPPGWDKTVNPGFVREAFLALCAQTKEDLSGSGLAVPHPADEKLVNLSDVTTKDLSKVIPADLTASAAGEFISIRNSGLIILHPFLKMFFKGLGLVHDNKFTNEQSCQKAALLLHFLATGLTEASEPDLTLQKILCGMSPDTPLPRYLEITGQETAECEHLLLSAMSHWPPLKNTSIEGLRTSFLQRDGQLSLKEAGWFLQIEHKTIDILLDKMPWGFSMIKLPWMLSMLSVEWRSPY